MRRILTTLIAAMIAVPAFCQTRLEVKILDGEHWWGGLDDYLNGRLGTQEDIPWSASSQISFDLRTGSYSNQCVPFLVSDKGRYIWSDSAFAASFRDGSIFLEGEDDLKLTQAGSTLREAYLDASGKHFPPSGTIPPEEFIRSPQYNTWIELTYNQNQKDILKYAHAIVDNGFPVDAVLMIDDNWQKYYGNFEFKPERFSDPKGMFDELHGLGFKAMLWVCPFISPDSPEYRFLAKEGYLIKDAAGKYPLIRRWWNGYSAVVDLSNPDARAWFAAQLKGLQENFGVDGFKLDAGDAENYVKGTCTVYDGKSYGPEQTLLWAKFTEEFPYNEFRACWKMAGQPAVQRLQDKSYSWDGVARLMPSMLASGIEGHIYNCPDMVGGGEFGSFIDIDEDKFDQDLIVRSCQIHSMMPMMQFSVAPWRILDGKHLDICKSYAKLHADMGQYLLDQAHKCSHSGEPLIRSMEYAFPGEGFETCTDQYMLGDTYLVAPMYGPGYSRTVKLPKGTWVDETGKKYKGGREYTLEVPIERLPYFTMKR